MNIILRCLTLIGGVLGLPVVHAQSILPQPTFIERTTGEYEFRRQDCIWVDPEFEDTIQAARAALSPATGYTFRQTHDINDAELRFLFDADLPTEGYELDVTALGVTIRASSDAGAFYAIQTLRQLLPVDVFKTSHAQSVRWVLPFVTVRDEPKYEWRGMHMDVSRHFQTVDTVKRFLDIIAIHKFNRFHWHLTDDQGWRIEIRRYPLLTEIGSCRAQTVTDIKSILQTEFTYDGTPHCGFYSQEEIADIVDYAAKLHIVIVPEIEFPGHSQAAIAAYPEIGNLGTSPGVKEEWGISKHVLNVRPETIDFYRNVFTEVMELFPSEHIHIGGDEAPIDQWSMDPFAQEMLEANGFAKERALQAMIIGQIHDHIRDNGRIMVGWDEILKGDALASDAVVMVWRDVKYGIQAAEAGHKVVMAPTKWTYFDYYQGNLETEPQALPFYTPLQKVYEFDPEPQGVSELVAANIMGAQGQLWGEMIPTETHLEYMAFPRAIALAESVWSSNKPGFENFSDRLELHLERLDLLQVNYRPLGGDELSESSAAYFEGIEILLAAYLAAEEAKEK